MLVLISATKTSMNSRIHIQIVSVRSLDQIKKKQTGNQKYIAAARISNLCKLQILCKKVLKQSEMSQILPPFIFKHSIIIIPYLVMLFHPHHHYHHVASLGRVEIVYYPVYNTKRILQYVKYDIQIRVLYCTIYTYSVLICTNNYTLLWLKRDIYITNQVCSSVSSNNLMSYIPYHSSLDRLYSVYNYGQCNLHTEIIQLIRGAYCHSF